MGFSTAGGSLVSTTLTACGTTCVFGTTLISVRLSTAGRSLVSTGTFCSSAGIRQRIVRMRLIPRTCSNILCDRSALLKSGVLDILKSAAFLNSARPIFDAALSLVHIHCSRIENLPVLRGNLLHLSLLDRGHLLIGSLVHDFQTLELRDFRSVLIGAAGTAGNGAETADHSAAAPLIPCFISV